MFAMNGKEANTWDQHEHITCQARQYKLILYDELGFSPGYPLVILTQSNFK